MSYALSKNTLTQVQWLILRVFIDVRVKHYVVSSWAWLYRVAQK